MGSMEELQIHDAPEICLRRLATGEELLQSHLARDDPIRMMGLRMQDLKLGLRVLVGEAFL